MDRFFVFNYLSCPAANSSEAYTLVKDMFDGMLQYGNDGDRVFLYADNKLSDSLFSNNYRYGDFLNDLIANNELEMHSVLLEIEDKSPMLYHFSDEILEELNNLLFFFPSEGFQGSIDILAAAWYLDAVLLSIGSDKKWRVDSIEYDFYPQDDANHQLYASDNIYSKEQGRSLWQKTLNEPIAINDSIYPDCAFNDHFTNWFNTLASDIREKVKKKFDLAYKRKFLGGEPLFDTLTGKSWGGIRELRSSSVQGGAIRILFFPIVKDGSSKIGIACGFIKKSNNGGYDEHKTIATNFLLN